eukprot:CAMPEP_0197515238 /NCGR_PEP_ID=MMETSP1318-20131121/430_1 /TAXON_ID=552666 /ORGANISM="Partenskyella glossopodia, Strain RCC365" /LENGTH=93 /DNA_ID=CAMNT_0043063549 /DNA_START=119 /DNA_END=396 /DNA_ORIENTATION=-
MWCELGRCDYTLTVDTVESVGEILRIIAEYVVLGPPFEMLLEIVGLMRLEAQVQSYLVQQRREQRLNDLCLLFIHASRAEQQLTLRRYPTAFT